MENFKYHDLLSIKVIYERKSHRYKDAYYPNHPYARQSGYKKYHHLVMENMIGRYIKRGEVVHHKDKNRLNNNPSNLQLLDSIKEHAKLHRLPPPERVCKQCGKRFKVIERTIEKKQTKYSNRKHCSKECRKVSQRKHAVEKSGMRVKNKPTKEELHKLVWEIPTEKVGKMFGVSGRAVGKWCKKYGVDKPPRGYWMKKGRKSEDTNV